MLKSGRTYSLSCLSVCVCLSIFLSVFVSYCPQPATQILNFGLRSRHDGIRVDIFSVFLSVFMSVFLCYFPQPATQILNFGLRSSGGKDKYSNQVGNPVCLSFCMCACLAFLSFFPSGFPSSTGHADIQLWASKQLGKSRKMSTQIR